MSDKRLVIGGGGFIGSNMVNYLLETGCSVTVLDNLSRKGSEKNVEWLRGKFKDRFNFIHGDVKDFEIVREAVKDQRVIYHFAAQVAVTTSVIDPRSDFEDNALGTFNVLDAIRLQNDKDITLFFTSTNKVYGGMEDVAVTESDGRYVYRDIPEGITEERNLDFHSPYGCSKGAADQYVRDFGRIYGFNCVVFRMSCIYGTRQFGNEDQGWVAHFIISSFFGKDLIIYGDGKQIRDVLYVDDLINAFSLALKNIDKTKGQIYNIGGGIKNTLSLLELIDYLEKLLNKRITYSFEDWRPGDQKVYVSNILKACHDFEWQPQVSREAGIIKLFNWVRENKGIFNIHEKT